MARPRVLRIQGRRVRLVVKSPVVAPAHGDNEFAGMCYSGMNLIELDAGLAGDEMRSVAVHEVVHDIESQIGMELTEQQVCALGSVLFAFIRDNPKFIEWVQEGR